MRAPYNIRGGGGRTGDLTIVWDPLPMQEQNSNGVYYRVYYRRIGVDPDRDFQQKTLKNLGNIGLYVVRINRKYYFTTYEVKVQVRRQDLPTRYKISITNGLYGHPVLMIVTSQKVHVRGHPYMTSTLRGEGG